MFFPHLVRTWINSYITWISADFISGKKTAGVNLFLWSPWWVSQHTGSPFSHVFLWLRLRAPTSMARHGIWLHRECAFKGWCLSQISGQRFSETLFNWTSPCWDRLRTHVSGYFNLKTAIMIFLKFWAIFLESELGKRFLAPRNGEIQWLGIYS